MQKTKFSVNIFFSKHEQMSGSLQICSHLLKKSLTENSIFCSLTYGLQSKVFHFQGRSTKLHPDLRFAGGMGGTRGAIFWRGVDSMMGTTDDNHQIF